MAIPLVGATPGGLLDVDGYRGQLMLLDGADQRPVQTGRGQRLDAGKFERG